MRAGPKRRCSPGENAATVIAFFADDKPKSGNGWARLADAYAATGRTAEALDALAQAWASADLSATDEQAIWARYGAQLHARRQRPSESTALLFAKKPDDAVALHLDDQPGASGRFRRANRDAAATRRTPRVVIRR